VYDSDASPPSAPRPKTWKKKKPTAATTVSTQQSHIQGTQDSSVPPLALTNSPAANTRR
jgi:hypothetical protein